MIDSAALESRDDPQAQGASYWHTALALAEKVRAALKPGTYDSLVFGTVFITNEMLEPETVGLGDEQEPATAMTVATIYWR